MLSIASLADARLRRGVALGILLLLCAAARASEDSTPVPLIAAERFALANGMRFVVVERPRAVTVSAGWLVATGTAHDPPGRTGMAHALEHLLFQGTGTIRPGELATLYARAGATGLNATTRRDFTAFFVSLPAEALELWFWLESDRLLDARFRDLGPERAAILEERQLRVDASPTGRLEEAASTAFWGDHPYGRPNSGRPEELRQLTLDELRSHFERHYRPANLVAVLVGPLTAADVRPLAELYFGRLEPADRASAAAEPAEAIVAEDPVTDVGDVPPASATATPLVGHCDCRPQIQLSYPAPAFADSDAVAAELLVALLNGRSGRLHRNLVLERGAVFAAYARHTRLRHAGRLTLIAEARRGGSPEALAALLEVELDRLRREPVGSFELDKAKNRLAANTLRRLEEPSELMLELLFHHGLGRGDLLDSWAAQLEAISAAEVQRLAERLFRPERRTTALFLRRGTGTEDAPP